MISKENRQYFIDPLPRPVTPTSYEGLKVLITRSRYERHDTQPGMIVDVNNTYMDSELWWSTTEGGRHVQGHVANRVSIDRRNRTRIAPITDDLFALVLVSDHRDDQPVVQAEVQAYSDPALPLRTNTQYGMFPLTVPAAPWAAELMPMPGDTQEVVAKKVELAKIKYEQKSKAIDLIREGQSRGWLYHLDTLREGHASYMPTPLFDLYAIGYVLIPTGQNAPESVIEAVSRRLAARGSRLPVPTASTAVTFVTTPITTMVEAQATYENAQNRDVELLRSHVRNAFGDSSLEAKITTTTPILRSVSN